MFAFLFVFCALSALLGQEDTLSDSLNMRLVGVWEAPISLPTAMHTHTLAVQDSFVYIYAGPETLYVLNISHPDSPYVLTRLIGDDWGAGVFVDSAVLCVSESGSLRFIDVSDPLNPVLISSLAYGGGLVRGFDLKSGLVVAGLRDWEVVDVTDLTSPRLVADLDSLLSGYFSPTSELYEVSLSGSYLHLGGARSEWDSGIGYWIDYGEYYCFNISEPTEPSLVRYRDFGMFTDVLHIVADSTKAFVGWSHYTSVSGGESYVSVIWPAGYQVVDLIGEGLGIGDMDFHKGYWCYRRPSCPDYFVLMDTLLEEVGRYRIEYDESELFTLRGSLYVCLLEAASDSPGVIYILKHDTIGVGVQDGGHGSLSPHYRIYPNPAAPGMTVNLEGIDFAEVYDLTGRLLCKTQNSVNTEKLQPGLYILRCNIKDKKIYEKLVVIN